MSRVKRIIRESMLLATDSSSGSFGASTRATTEGSREPPRRRELVEAAKDTEKYFKKIKHVDLKLLPPKLRLTQINRRMRLERKALLRDLKLIPPKREPKKEVQAKVQTRGSPPLRRKDQSPE